MWKKRVLQITAIITPFLCAFLVLFATGYGSQFKILVPVWNDKAGWFSQVAAMIRYGHPLGYYGYNGTHAAIGTFGAWGIAPLIPYYLFGSVFGWDIYSMSLANIFFLCCSVGVFIRLTKPDCRQLVQIIIMYSCLNITIGYSITSMSEGLRYSIGIVLTGMLIYLSRCLSSGNKDGWGKRQYIAVITFGLFIFFAVHVYLIFALAIPVYCCIILSNTKKFHKFRVPISIIMTFIASMAANFLVGIVTSPYTTSTLANMINAFKQDGIYNGVYYCIHTLFTNLQTVNLFLQNENGDVLAWFFLKYVAVTILLIWRITEAKRKNENVMYYAVSLYILLGFLIGYCQIYTGSNWTLCRGINTGFTIFLFYLCLNKDFRMKKLIVFLSLISVMSTYGYFQSLTAERQAAAESMSGLADEKERISEIVCISPDQSRWENTMACYGDIPLCLALPDGAGLNCIMDGSINVNAKYAVVAQSARGDYLELLQKNNHEIIYENSGFLILLNRNNGGSGDGQ